MQAPVITFVSLYRGQALYCRPSLGVAYVQAFLRTNNVESRQYVSRVPITFDALIDEVILTGSDVVGMACYEHNFPCVAMLATALKKRKKDLVLIVGGPSATFADEAILKDCPSVEFCIRGEGEYTTLEFLDALRRGRHFETVLGLSYRRSGRVVRASDRPLVANLDDLPSPYLTGVVPAAEGGIVNSLGIVTARGCPFKCIYCNFSIMGRQRVRFHSVDRVVQELCTLHRALRTGAVLREPVPIYDDTFTVNPDRTRAICCALAREGVHGLEFDIQTRADSLDSELLGMLRQIGVTRVNFGLESGVPRVLNLIQKVRSGQRGADDGFAAEKRYISRVQDMATAARDRGIRVSIGTGYHYLTFLGAAASQRKCGDHA